MLHIDPRCMFGQETAYYLDRDGQASAIGQVVALPPEQRLRAVFLCVPALLSPPERLLLGELATRHPLHIVSGYLMLDLRRPGPGVDAEEAVQPLHRSALRRYFEGPYAHPLLARDAGISEAWGATLPSLASPMDHSSP